MKPLLSNPIEKVKTLTVKKETYYIHFDQECMMLKIILENYM